MLTYLDAPFHVYTCCLSVQNLDVYYFHRCTHSHLCILLGKFMYECKEVIVIVFHITQQPQKDLVNFRNDGIMRWIDISKKAVK